MIKLKNHVSSNATVEIKTQECMEHLTAIAYPKKILEDPIIKNNKKLLCKMVSANWPVNLFDESTWPDELNFTLLVCVVHNVITPTLCQNQRITSYI
jgi:hypothetical protein